VIDNPDRRLGYPFVMYYNAKTTSGYERIGMAVSSDMTKWTRFGKGPVIDNGSAISGDPQLLGQRRNGLLAGYVPTDNLRLLLGGEVPSGSVAHGIYLRLGPC